MNIALRARWLGLKRVDGSRPWAEFDIDINVPLQSVVVYQPATHVDVGNGRLSFFWEDRSLDGWRIQEIAPRLYDRIRPRIRKTHTVADALAGVWPRDLRLNLPTEELQEYLTLWAQVTGVELREEVEDSMQWAWAPSGLFSVCSAYATGFAGLQHDLMAMFIWQS